MEGTRERILNTSIDLFYENGYAGCTMRSIGEACGLTHAAIYKHFKSKDEIAGILARRFQSAAVELTRRFAAGHTKRETLFYAWAAQTRLFARDTRFASFFIAYLKTSSDLSEILGTPTSDDENWLFELIGFESKRLPAPMAFEAMTATHDLLFSHLIDGTLGEREVTMYLISYCLFLAGSDEMPEEAELGAFYQRYMDADALVEYDIARDFLHTRFGEAYDAEPRKAAPLS